MEKLVNKELDDLVFYIKNTSSYKNCILIKEKMNKNKELCQIISKVKTLQKKYVRSDYNDDSLYDEINRLKKKLTSIPIYNEYMMNLKEVNEMIDFVRDSINTYFDKLLND